MRFASPGLSGLAVLGMLVVPAAGDATARRLPLPFVAPLGARPSSASRPRRFGTATQPAGCTSDSSSGRYFVGIPSLNDVAGGAGSGVLAGDSNQACAIEAAIGGGFFNIIGPAGDVGIGEYSFIGGGEYNGVSGSDAFVGAGYSGEAPAQYAFVGAGDANVASGQSAFAGAGNSNVVAGAASFVGAGNSNASSGGSAFVGSGQQNVASNVASFVGGGGFNMAGGAFSVVVGGDTNSAGGSRAFVGGGSRNTIAGSAAWGTVGGGHGNEVSGLYATIPGGSSNTAAGVLSFAAGYHADATRTGSFVWSDYVAGSSAVTDTAPDQFVVRASGGMYVYSSENLKAGVKLGAGSGTWASLSDRSAKTDISALDDAAILAKVATLPVSTWRYKTEAGVRHVGPMAQDFYAAFGVGEDDRHITSIDEDGVALAAIKALRANVVALQAHNAALQAGTVRLRTDNATLHAENATLNNRLTALEKKVEALAAK